MSDRRWWMDERSPVVDSGSDRRGGWMSDRRGGWMSDRSGGTVEAIAGGGLIIS